MTPDQTITISCDYFIEFFDDGGSDGPDPDIIVMAPQPQGGAPGAAQGAASKG